MCANQLPSNNRTGKAHVFRGLQPKGKQEMMDITWNEAAIAKLENQKKIGMLTRLDFVIVKLEILVGPINQKEHEFN